MAAPRPNAAGKTAPAQPKAAAAPQPTSSSAPPPQPAFLQSPPITTDNPWRDLHPARVWPD